jgi:hypothetical protein
VRHTAAALGSLLDRPEEDAADRTADPEVGSRQAADRSPAEVADRTDLPEAADRTAAGREERRTGLAEEHRTDHPAVGHRNPAGAGHRNHRLEDHHSRLGQGWSSHPWSRTSGR